MQEIYPILEFVGLATLVGFAVCMPLGLPTSLSRALLVGAIGIPVGEQIPLFATVLSGHSILGYAIVPSLLGVAAVAALFVLHDASDAVMREAAIFSAAQRQAARRRPA